MGEAVGRGDDEGVEGVAGVEHWGLGSVGARSDLVLAGVRATAGPGGPWPAPADLAEPGSRRVVASSTGVVDRGDHLELDREVPTHGPGDGVLDEPEEPRLDPVPDQGVGHPEDDLVSLMEAG